MSYQEEYRQKLTTAEEAVKVVKSGDWVDYGWCTNTAEVLTRLGPDAWVSSTT